MSNAEQVLKKLGIKDETYIKFMREGTKPFTSKMFNVMGMDFVISHFLGFSNVPGFDLIMTNAMLPSRKEYMVAIALVEGDDVVCLNSDDNSISIWLVQTGNGEYLKVASSFELFLCIAVDFK